MDLSKMTDTELTQQMDEVKATLEAIEHEKMRRKNLLFDELVGEIVDALDTLRKEFPYAECKIQVDTYSGPENVNILTNSDLLEFGRECFSMG